MGGGACKSRWCPNFVITILSLMTIPKYKVTLEDVAALMSSNLGANSQFSRQRVSLVFS